MHKEEVETYADTSNHAVLRHPGRNFPGTLIQGDSLSILCNSADSIRRELDKGDIEEAREELEYLRELLWGRLQHYEKVLVKHGLNLPYSGGKETQPPLEVFEDHDTT